MGKNLDTKLSSQFIDGANNILLTAPHSDSHRRPTLTGSLKQGEDSTDQIVKVMCEQLGCKGLIARDTSEYDPNFHNFDKNPFKQDIKDCMGKDNFEALLDIHGLSDKKKYDIAIYYEKGFKNSKDLAYKVAEGLSLKRMRGALIHVYYLPHDRGEPIAQYAAKKLRIPSIQIEIASYIRNDDKLRLELVKNLSAVLKQL